LFAYIKLLVLLVNYSLHLQTHLSQDERKAYYKIVYFARKYATLTVSDHTNRGVGFTNATRGAPLRLRLPILLWDSMQYMQQSEAQMAEKTRSRQGMVIGALAALVLAAFIVVMRQRGVPDLIVQSDEGWAGEVRVAIAGEVIAPGTYTLRGDARLADVIAAAGGYTDAAARDILNPAARVNDGQAYTIPLQPPPAPRTATTAARATTVAAALATPTRSPNPTHTGIPSPPTAASTELVGDIPPVDVPPFAETATATAGITGLGDIAAYVISGVETFLEDDPTGTGTPEASGTPRATRAPRGPRVLRPPSLPHAAPTVHATSPPRPTATPHPAPTVAAVRAATVRPATTVKTASTSAAPATHAVKMAPAASIPPVKKAGINSAPQEELASLPHISTGLARRVVADRSAHGRYKSAEDLLRVPGISRRTVEELRNSLTTE